MALLPRASQVALTISAGLIGAFLGVSLFTFTYAQGASYLTDNAASCANCHVMREQFEGWMKSSHRSAAVCNDCHTPPGFFAKYTTKAANGFFHSLAFTTGWFPDQIQINQRNYQVTESSCIKCHSAVVDGINATRAHQRGAPCVGCHRIVGHH